MPPSTTVDRILALAADLAADLEGLTLNEVDGECYWRGCRLDLLERAEARRAAAAGVLGDDGQGDVFAFITKQQRTDRTWSGEEKVVFVHFVAAVVALYSWRVLYRLQLGLRIGLRQPWIDVSEPSDGAPQPLVLWMVPVDRGPDVERVVERALPELCQRWPLPAGGREAGEARVGLRVVTDPVGIPPGGFLCRASDPFLTPYVEVTVPLPAPARGVIGAAYDAFLDGLEEAGLGLLGTGQRQEPRVAVRTWITALLMAEGLRFAKAHPLACEAIGCDAVSQKEDGEQRRRLLQRVPEAEPYIRAGRGVKAAGGPASAPR